MKNFKTFFTIIAIGAVFGLIFAGCSTGDPGGIDPVVEAEVKDSISAKWTISGSSYTSVEFNQDNTYIVVVVPQGTTEKVRAGKYSVKSDS